MSEIRILTEFPIILTRENWQPRVTAKAGAIIRLPADAVLVKPRNLKKELVTQPPIIFKKEEK